ncbi:MAG: hypothetical protein U5K51_01605 [Flavobacteriaceae bacterium]|nr:hypothetical protein [Flavobacteriaceae bacterium]
MKKGAARKKQKWRKNKNIPRCTTTGICCEEPKWDPKKELTKKILKKFLMGNEYPERLAPKKAKVGTKKANTLPAYQPVTFFMKISLRFNTSLTSVVYRCFRLNIHPIFIASIHKGKVLYWLKSPDLKVFVKDLSKLPPPEDSIAMEYIHAKYDFVYKENEKTQQIEKSTWFQLNKYDKDTPFFEYCIPTKAHETILSVVWEE